MPPAVFEIAFPSKRAEADPCLIPRGHRDWQILFIDSNNNSNLNIRN